MDPQLHRPGQDVPDLLTRMGVPARLDAGRDFSEHLARSPSGSRGWAEYRFCAERAVSVVADWAVQERRWSTFELLAVEQRLVTSATDRTGERTAVASHEAVGEALAAHPTAGPDQQAMGRICTFTIEYMDIPRPGWETGDC